VLIGYILGAFAALSLLLLLWQWLVGRRFPLHKAVPRSAGDVPGVTILKPIKGRDERTKECLRTWFLQDYAGPAQLLFGVVSTDDAACSIVRELLLEFPSADARLVVCGSPGSANAKVSKLATLMKLAKHDAIVISDADVSAPVGCVREMVHLLKDSKVGLANAFYRYADPITAAMFWEAAAVNVDFWSQVLQSRSLKAIDFALGAVMATRREQLQRIGGFERLQDCLADDYQLGNRIAKQGLSIVLASTVVSCHGGAVGWREVWKHQLRWARTIRVCQPVPYFFSILSNPTLWPVLWAIVQRTPLALGFAGVALVLRTLSAWDLERRLAGAEPCRSGPWWILVKDVLQIGVWFLAFTGNQVEWRGERYWLRPDGNLVRLRR
jgi:ceramide glucosyltransferase